MLLQSDQRLDRSGSAPIHGIGPLARAHVLARRRSVPETVVCTVRGRSPEMRYQATAIPRIDYGHRHLLFGSGGRSPGLPPGILGPASRGPFFDRCTNAPTSPSRCNDLCRLLICGAHSRSRPAVRSIPCFPSTLGRPRARLCLCCAIAVSVLKPGRYRWHGRLVNRVMRCNRSRPARASVPSVLGSTPLFGLRATSSHRIAILPADKRRYRA